MRNIVKRSDFNQARWRVYFMARVCELETAVDRRRSESEEQAGEELLEVGYLFARSILTDLQ